MQIGTEVSKKLLKHGAPMREMQFSGGDALLGNTRPHPEHDG